jgi:hypothetical protein
LVVTGWKVVSVGISVVASDAGMGVVTVVAIDVEAGVVAVVVVGCGSFSGGEME